MEYARKGLILLIVFAAGIFLSPRVSPSIFYPDLDEVRTENDKLLGHLREVCLKFNQISFELALEKKLNEIAWKDNIDLEKKIGNLEEEISILQEIILNMQKPDNPAHKDPPEEKEFHNNPSKTGRGC